MTSRAQRRGTVIPLPRSIRTMGFCALNGLFWASAAGWVGGMAMAPPSARAETAHARFMAKRRAQVR